MAACANATIMVLRVPPRASAVRARYQTARPLASWNRRKRQASWIMPRRTRALPALASPFSRRLAPLSSGEPVEAGVAGHRPSVAQVAREDLVHQHVRRLDADADHACQQPNHRVRPFVGCLAQSFEARLLDLGDLAGHEAQPRHVASQLGERVRRQGHALRRTQRLQTPRRLAQGRPEPADAEARQAIPYPIDDAGALADQALPLPVRALGVLFLERRDLTCCSGPARRAASRGRPA